MLLPLLMNLGMFGTATTSVAGGAGRPVYRVRKWRETKTVVEEGFQSVFEELSAAELPKDVMGEVVAAVKIHADKQGRYRKIPRLNEVDWKGLEADAKTARRLVDIYEQHVARLAFEQLIEEEDEILLLH